MKTLIGVLIIIEIWHCCYAPPVTKNEKEHSEGSEAETMPLDYIHYSRYLKQIVNALESDPDFKKKLEEASEDDIKSGKIANELDFVSHHVRNKLDELKRIELERLIDIKHRLSEQERNNNEITGDPLHGHLDHYNKLTFEVEDLKRLIIKTTEDLADADRKRRDDFKQYELQKEFEKQEKLNHTNGEDERAKLEKHYKEMEEKHKKHEPLHQPGHKAQLEEVWQERDHMQQKFDPVAFFMMHDHDSNGGWDHQEVAALFMKQLDTIYKSGAPEDDLRERAEEMERMREAVFKEMDRDRDGFISMQEFIDQTRRNEFQQDNGWKSIDEQERPYSEEELQQYIKQQHKLHPPSGYGPPGGQYPPPPGSYHPNQVPQGYAPPGQYYQGQPPPQYQQAPQGHYQQPQYQPPPVQQHQQPQQPIQYQQPVPNQHPPVQGQPPNQPPSPPQGQQYQQPPVAQVDQLPPQNQPSPQINPHLNVNPQNPRGAGQSVQAP